MFRTEITFDTSLPQAEIEQLCAMTDAIFAKEDLVCTEKEYGRRVYADKRGAADFATIGVALMAMDDVPQLVKSITSAYWYHGAKKENLMETFFDE